MPHTKKTPAPATPDLFGPRWKELIRHLALADQVAYRLLIQAPWPTATDAIETDDAFQGVGRLSPRLLKSGARRGTDWRCAIQR